MNYIRAAVFSLFVIPGTLSLGFQEDSVNADGLHPRVKMETNRGDIIIELDGEKAPVSTWNFIQYVEGGFYNGTVFHRVIKDFMIQGGGFTEQGKKTEGLRSPIVNEWKNGLKNKRGAIAMARLGGQADSASSQFFINVVDNGGLDSPRDGSAYAVFGHVALGMDVVDKIRNTAVSTNPNIPIGPYVPVEPVVVKKVSVTGKVDRDKLKEKAAGVAKEREAQKAEAEAGMRKTMEELKTKAEKEAGRDGVTTSSGLMYVDLKPGDGETPGASDRVKVHYTGWLPDGTKFDSSVDRGQPFTFSLSGGVIRGWLEGVASMKVGGKRRLIIPPDLGYGVRGAPPKIGPNSVLVFDVELLGIE